MTDGKLLTCFSTGDMSLLVLESQCILMDKHLVEIKRLENRFAATECITGYNDSPELLFTYKIPESKIEGREYGSRFEINQTTNA